MPEGLFENKLGKMVGYQSYLNKEDLDSPFVNSTLLFKYVFHKYRQMSFGNNYLLKITLES